LASSLLPVEIRPGVSLATVTGTLQAKDNKFELEPLTKSQIQELTSVTPTQTVPPVNYTYGSFELQTLLHLLSQAGIYDVTSEQTQTGFMITLVRTTIFAAIFNLLINFTF